MRPKSAYIFLTNRCNLECKYCYEKNRTGDMTPETMEATVDYLIQYYNKEQFVRGVENLTFTFFGGEPLLNFPVVKHGLEYIRKKSNEIKFLAGAHILTNGTILTDEMIEFFKEFRAYKNFNWHIQVSLDGCEETHNANRVFKNGEGSYQKILNNIKIFRDIFPSVGVRQTITPGNIKSLFKDFTSIIDLNVPITNFTPIVEGEWTQEVLDIFESELKKCIDYYYNNGKTQFFNLIHQCFERMMSPVFNKQRGCRAGVDFIGIDVNGKIHPCHRFVAYSYAHDYCIGDVWKGIDPESMQYKKVKEMRICGKECDGCNVFSCNRCFATNMMQFKDPGAIPDNGYCEMNKKISDTLRPIIHNLVIAKKLNIRKGEMIDMGKKGVAFNVDKENEMAANKLDVMARCMVQLTKEIVQIKQIMAQVSGGKK